MSPPSDYARRKEARRRADARAHLVPVADEGLVQALLDTRSPVALTPPSGPWNDPIPTVPSVEDGAALLAGLRQAQEEHRLEAVLVASRRAVIDAIVRPFGIGALVARADRRGGPVLTLHNAQQARAEGWPTDYADQDHLQAFRARVEGGYDANIRAADTPKEWGSRKARAWERSGGVDAYTGRVVSRTGDTPETLGNVDHVISVKEMRKDEGVAFHLSEDKARELTYSDENLAVTSEAINKSKRDKHLLEWADGPSRKGPGTNAERNGVDRERATAAQSRAESHRDKTVNWAAFKHYAQETTVAAAGQAVTVGLVQALGLLLVELAEALYDEVVGLLAAVREPREGLLDDLADALRRVAERVVGKWRAGVDAFKEGAVGGALSAVITVIINGFVTTGKRVVRMLREGALSALRAVRTVLWPPPGLTREEAAHEATKLLAAALAVTGGIAAEEAVEKPLLGLPLVGAVASPLAGVLVGIGTGLTTVLLCWLLDQADIFGAQRIRENRSIGERLDADMAEKLAWLEGALAEQGV